MTRISIGFVSTYPPIECGVGEYTSMLAEALLAEEPRLEIYVFAPREAEWGSSTGRIRIVPVFERGERGYKGLLEALGEIGGVDVLHVQHEYGIFGDHTGIVEALLEARRRGLARITVATLHTVYHPLGLEKGKEARMEVQHSFSKLDAIIVHTLLQEFELIAEGVNPAKVHRVPHGTPLNPYSGKNPDRLLESLGMDPALAPRPRIVVPGFLRPDKGLSTLVEVARILRSRGFRGSIVTAGRPQGRGAAEAEALVKRAAEEGLLVHIDRYLSRDELLRLTASADIILLPYRDKPGKYSASGILHVAMGTIGPLIIGTRVARLVELYEQAPKLTVAPGDAAGLARLAESIIIDRERWLGDAERLWAYGARTSWRNTARQHLEIYESLLG